MTQTQPTGVPAIVVSILAPMVASGVRAFIAALTGAGVVVTSEQESNLLMWTVGIVGAIITLGWSYVEKRWFTKKVVNTANNATGGNVTVTTTVKPSPMVAAPLVLALISVGWFMLATMSGCATNSQRVKGGQLDLNGAPAGMNSLNVTAEQYGVVSRNPIGIVDGQNFSAAGENPMTVLQLTMADGQAFHLASGSNGRVGNVKVEDLKSGVVGTVELVEWDNAQVNESTASTALALYAAMKDLSKDEAEVRLKQIETTGEVASSAIGLARTLLGVP